MFNLFKFKKDKPDVATLYPVKISYLIGEEAKTKEVLIPLNESALKPSKLFYLLDRFKDIPADTELAEYNAIYTAAWLEVDVAVVKEYFTTEGMSTILELTAWFNKFYTKLDTASAPKEVTILDQVINVKSCYDNLTVGTLELINKADAIKDALKIVHSCLRVEDSLGIYKPITPVEEAIEALDKLPAVTVYALLNFFLTPTKNTVKTGKGLNLLHHLNRILTMKIILQNLAR